MEQHQHKLNKVVFSSLIHACSISGQQSRTEHWLTSMLKSGIEPTLLCYNMVIQVCALNGNCDAAVHWFGKLLSSNLTPDKCTYMSLIEVSARTGDASTVDLLFRDMISNGLHPDELTSLALARGSAHVANEEGRTDVRANCMSKSDCVQQWHGKLISDGIHPPQAFYKEWALCEENQNFNEATIQPTFKMLQQTRTPPHAKEFVNDLCKSDDLTKIISTLECIISQGS